MAFFRKTRASKRSTAKSTIVPVVAELPIPDQFRCPISLDLMNDPVTAPAGITYDRQSIERWLTMGNFTCPVTNMPLSLEDLIPNHNIRRLIQDWCVANRSHGIERIPTPRIPISQFAAFEILSDISLASKRRDGERCLELSGRVSLLVKESERNRRCFVSIGAPAVLASAFRVSASRTILAALVALLPYEDEIVMRELGSPESLDSITQIMKSGDISSRLNAVLMVKKMASVREYFTQKNGLIEALVDVIRKPISTQATKAALAATFYLVAGDEAMGALCVNLGMVPLVLEIMVDSDKSMTEKALAVLDALCGCEAGREKACGHSLAIPVLAKKMFRVSDMATELVISTFWKLCKNCKGGCLVECLQVGVFQKLLLLLQVGCSESSKEKATEMLKLMSLYSGKLECVDTGDFKGLNRRS